MRKVLVVEDDRFISTIFTMFLREIGHEMVGRCATGREAIEMCREHTPEVVLMDIHLDGDWDGIQTAERITREFNIPVVFISSDTNSDIIGRAIESNSYGYLVKPILKNELAISIDLAYYKYQADQELKQREKGFRQFISDSPMPIMIVNNGRVQYVNNIALALLRSHYIEDVIGLPFHNFVSGNMPDNLKSIVDESISDSGVVNDTFAAMKDVHGNLFYAELFTSSVEFNQRKSVQIIMRDILSELKLEIKSKALSSIAKTGSCNFFLLDSKLSLHDFSDSLENLKSIVEIKGDRVVCKSNFKLQDADNKDVTERVLSGDVDGVNGSLSVFIDGNNLGSFKVEKLNTAINDYYGLLFY